MSGRGRYHTMGRRRFLASSAALSVGALGACRPQAPSVAVANPTPRMASPQAEWGVQSGDVGAHDAVIWARADREASMTVEWSLSPDFTDARRVPGPLVRPETDFCGKLRISELPTDTRIHYRARFDDAVWMPGSFTTAPGSRRDVTFAWSADTNGQGFGIDPSRGGMPAYRALLDRRPELFLHLGDQIYADNPIPPSLELPDGSRWNNLVTPEKLAFAETLNGYRGAHRYPRLSPEVRALSASVPMFGIWDDHEVKDNWFPGMEIDQFLYKSKSVDPMIAPALQASLEYHPTLRQPTDPMNRIIPWGPHLDIFMVDGRSFRTKNHPRAEIERFFGEAQTTWLAESVAASKATWKVIGCDMPLGLILGNRLKDGTFDQDAFGYENGQPQGRERELARIFGIWRQRKVKNVVFLTADVHYAAAHHFQPARAQWKEMIPFWEFIAGPMHSMQFGLNPLDDTFGPELAWSNVERGAIGRPSDTATQTFGMVRIEGATGIMTVTHADGAGRDLHETVLKPA